MCARRISCLERTDLTPIQPHFSDSPICILKQLDIQLPRHAQEKPPKHRADGDCCNLLYCPRKSVKHIAGVQIQAREWFQCGCWRWVLSLFEPDRESKR